MKLSTTAVIFLFFWPLLFIWGVLTVPKYNFSFFFFFKKYFDCCGRKKYFNDLPARAQGEEAMTDLSELTREGKEWRRVKKYTNTHCGQRQEQMDGDTCNTLWIRGWVEQEFLPFKYQGWKQNYYASIAYKKERESPVEKSSRELCCPTETTPFFIQSYLCHREAICFSTCQVHTLLMLINILLLAVLSLDNQPFYRGLLLFFNYSFLLFLILYFHCKDPGHDWG